VEKVSFCRCVLIAIDFSNNINVFIFIDILDSQAIEKLTKLLNDTFDVLNGRCYEERITILNWHVKKSILDDMLCVLDQSEKVYKETGTTI